ncbi:MAG: dihydropteroate synthase [Microthrixaceae bacterium]|nr:dihydropteroate synthase [Microthrixaceae bacterium]
MMLFGVVNCSSDSLNTDSYVRDEAEARTRIDTLLVDGAQGVDIGGQGSTDRAILADWKTEWTRVEPVIAAALERTSDVSIDSWRPEVVRRALEAGANTINAANGMQNDTFWELAATFEAAVVVPFMNGPNPLELRHVDGDPIDAMIAYFTERLATADRFGVRSRCLLDPGTGFGPHGWEWEDRYHYQKHVYSNLERLRVFDLPLYIPLPWKRTAQHDELLEIVLARRPDYGRAHYPAHIRSVEASVVGSATPNA